MVDITIDTFVEADYFADLVMSLAASGVEESQCEEFAHKILDTHTVDGVLDTETIDCVIDRLLGLGE